MWQRFCWTFGELSGAICLERSWELSLKYPEHSWERFCPDRANGRGGLGSQTAANPPPPLATFGEPHEKQTVGTVTASHKMCKPASTFELSQASTAKRGCLGRGKAFGWPLAVCPLTHYRFWRFPILTLWRADTQIWECKVSLRFFRPTRFEGFQRVVCARGGNLSSLGPVPTGCNNSFCFNFLQTCQSLILYRIQQGAAAQIPKNQLLQPICARSQFLRFPPRKSPPLENPVGHF